MSKKFFIISSALVLVCLCALSAFAQEEVSTKPDSFVVYADKGSRENHYIPSGWMGDYGDIRMNDGSLEYPYSGSTCIKFEYSAQKSQSLVFPTAIFGI